MVHRFDFLVIGSGIAGLSYALKASAFGSVAIITKKEKAESNTNYAQGGVAAVMSVVDSFEMHVKDTLSTGQGLSHCDAVETMVKEGPDRLRELVDLGAEFTMTNGQLDLAREGGHSTSRIVHSKDLTGREIERALLHSVAITPNIVTLENHVAIELLTEHHTSKKQLVDRSNTHCWGVYALNQKNHRVDTFFAKVVMLCTGGLGHVYLHTTNPPIATGDGVAMSHRAGAKIGNMEFIQFHPTTLFNSGNPSFLISEAVRG
ncbi:MAG TPA: L-aspartate oxidase, partial [Bacteroidetes bacterium]|nr:L-aspartate oxidase [Bacteroidota bacterium]